MQNNERSTARTNLLVVLLMLGVIGIWDTRYTWSVGNVMHGWPMPWANLWYQGQHEWSLSILLLDLLIWLAIAVATADAAIEIREKIQRPQLLLLNCMGLTFVVAVLLLMYHAEQELKLSPQNEAIYPEYARRVILGRECWFDLGLFTNRFNQWLLIRLPIVFGIGCVVYRYFALFCTCIHWMNSKRCVIED